MDTHAHLDMPLFDKDRAGVIAYARDSGVDSIITIGIDLASSRRAVELAEGYPEIVAAVGCHPHSAAGVNEKDIAELERLAVHDRVVAIGEVGLDFYRDYSPRAVQLQVLKWQLKLAAELKLPVIIHSRQADEAILPVLSDWHADCRRLAIEPRGVIYCFNGQESMARKYLDMGFYISFGAYIGYPAAQKLPPVIREIPVDRLLVETDCPYLPPQGRRGQRNEPAYLPLTVKRLAEIRGVTPAQIARETTENARYLFCLQGFGAAKT